jgi:hypothetical protein
MQNITSTNNNLFSTFTKAIETDDKDTLYSVSMENKEAFNKYLNEKDNGITRYNRIMGGATIINTIKEYIQTFLKNTGIWNTDAKLDSLATNIGQNIKPSKVDNNLFENLLYPGDSMKNLNSSNTLSSEFSAQIEPMSDKRGIDMGNLVSSKPFLTSSEKITSPITKSQEEIMKNLKTEDSLSTQNIAISENNYITSPITKTQQEIMRHLPTITSSAKSSETENNYITSPITKTQQEIMRHLPTITSSAKSSETDSIFNRIGKAVDEKISAPFEGYGVTPKYSPFLNTSVVGKVNNPSKANEQYSFIQGGGKKKTKKMVDMTGNNEIKRTRTNYKLIDSFNRNKNDNEEEFEAEDDVLSRATPEQDEKYKNLVNLIMETFGVDESTAKAYRYAFKNYVVTENEELKKDEDKKTEEIEKIIKNKKLSKKILEDKKTEIEEMALKIKNRQPVSSDKKPKYKKEKKEKKEKVNTLNYILSDDDYELHE